MDLKRPLLPADPAERRERLLRLLLTLLAMAMPLLISLVLTGLRGYRLFHAVPLWYDDEFWWNAQYAAVGAYGRPLGYFGYAGTHATVGTWGPWGMFPCLLTGLLARVFGWYSFSFLACNYFYLAAAVLCFILLTKPSLRGLAGIAVSSVLMFVAICYSVSFMNECARYAMAIVLAGLMYRIAAVPEVSKTRFILRCTLIPLLLLYATGFYLILGLFIPVYLFLMLRRLRPVWRAVAALPVSAAAIYLIRDLNADTCAPYIPDNAAAFSLPSSTLRQKLFNEYFSILGNLRGIDPFSLATGADVTDAPALLWFCVLGYVGMGFLIWRVCAAARDPARRLSFTVSAVSLYLLAGFWFGHVVMYNTTTWTFMRGCSTAVCAVLLLGALQPPEERQAWRAMCIASLAGAITFLSVFTVNFAPGDRFATDAQELAWAEQRAALAEVIVLDPDAADPWSNTVAMRDAPPEAYYALPAGAGINGYPLGGVNENARYVIVGGGAEERAAAVEAMTEAGHRVLLETDGYAVLENTARDFG